MDFHGNGIDSKLEFWPVEHPHEPMEEDRPVKCPNIPDTSAMNDEKSYEEESYEILRRKAKFVAVMDEKEMLLGRRTPRVARRKRPHMQSQMRSNHTATSLITMSPLYPFSTLKK